jgi:hypothetical protein
MIPFVQNHVIHLLALGRETKAACAQPFGQVLLGFAVSLCACGHAVEKMTQLAAAVKI